MSEENIKQEQAAAPAEAPATEASAPAAEGDAPAMPAFAAQANRYVFEPAGRRHMN